MFSGMMLILVYFSFSFLIFTFLKFQFTERQAEGCHRRPIQHLHQTVVPPRDQTCRRGTGVPHHAERVTQLDRRRVLHGPYCSAEGAD